MISKSLRARSERDQAITSQLWKCDQIARKISSYSGLTFEELRDAAREYLVKIHDSWNPEKANFSTWVNRCLNFYMLNYLRDRSRLIRIPRSYSDLYLKIRKIQKRDPDLSQIEIAEVLGVSQKKVQNVLEAFSTKFSGTAEYCFAESDQLEHSSVASEDFMSYMGSNYTHAMINVANLPEKDEQFLNDYLVKKRSHKTLMKNYPHLKSIEDIKSYSNTLIDSILSD